MSDEELTAVANAAGVLADAPPVRPADVAWAVITGVSMTAWLVLVPLIEGVS